jgi:hypothetical protein
MTHMDEVTEDTVFQATMTIIHLDLCHVRVREPTGSPGGAVWM